MPSATSSNIFHSKLFTFLIGVDETPVTVHSGAVAALSVPLDPLINGSFKEAQENCARFPDIKMGDFEKICAVAYGAELMCHKIRTLPPSEVNIKHDFWVFSPRIIGPESYTLRNTHLTAHLLYATIGDLNHLPNLPRRTDSKVLYENTVDGCYKCRLLCDADEDTSLGLPNLSNQSGETEAQLHTSWKQDVSGVLLGYARIYLFAKKYLIAKLQKDVEAGLRRFLARMDVYQPTRFAFLELIQYVYNDEIVPNRGNGEDMHPLLEMVVHFVALHFFVFYEYTLHRELMRRGGDYALDLQDVIAE